MFLFRILSTVSCILTKIRFAVKFRNALVIIVLLVIPVVSSCFAAPKVPEKLIYSLSWTGIPVGVATQEIVNEGDVRRIFSTARSNDWLSTFFPVDDRTESILKKSGEFPGTTRNFKMLFKEGTRVRDREITFNPSAKTAHYFDRTKNQHAVVPLPAETFDIYSSFYYVRYQTLEPGKSLFINLLDSKKLHRIEGRVLRRERIKVPAGEFNTIVIEPMVKPEGVFEGKRGAYIWLSDDSRRIPVKAQTKVRVGSVTAVLTGGNF
jgi:hypothetical protein